MRPAQTTILAAFLCLGAGTLSRPLTAQVVPSGFNNREGNSWCVTFGVASSQRFQLLEGELSNQFVNFARIGFRLDDSATVSVATNAGRAWTRVTIDIANTNVPKASATFAKNYASAGTRVFDAAFSFPELTSNPTRWPAGFDQRLSFPLKRRMVFSRRAFLVDWQFHGGTLRNQTWPSPSPFRVYHLDAAPQGSATSIWQINYRLLPLSGSCTTTGVSNVQLYGSNYANPRYAGRMTYTVGISQAPANAPYVYAVAPAGSDVGVPVPAACHNRLHVDLSQVLQFSAGTTGNSGLGAVGNLLAYSKSFLGARLFAQSAFTQPATGAFSLSQALRLDIPDLPGARAYNRAVVWAASTSASTGTLQLPGGLQAAQSMPITR